MLFPLLRGEGLSGEGAAAAKDHHGREAEGQQRTCGGLGDGAGDLETVEYCSGATIIECPCDDSRTIRLN